MANAPNLIRWRLVRAGKWLLILLVLLGIIAWLRFSPLTVDSYPVGEDVLVAEVLGTGTLEARVSTAISPKISGRIAAVLVDQGDVVERDQLLVQLDDEEFQQQVAIAEAHVEAAQAAIVRLAADKERAAVVFEQAERNHRRIEGLVQRGATTEEEFEEATEALAVAMAEVSRAEAAIAGGQKDLLATEKTLQYHQARLRDTRMASPFSGLIVDRQREAGDIVVPGSSILTLIATDVLWIQAWVDETEMSRLAVNQPARVVFRSEPDHQFHGRVARLGREVDRETREFVVDVEVLELPRNWAVGQRADVFIESDRAERTLVIPGRLLFPTDEGHAVLVEERGIARRRQVELGLRGRERVEIKEGLERDELVVDPRDRTWNQVEGRRVAWP